MCVTANKRCLCDAGDGSDDGEWADCDSVEDVEGAEMMDAPQVGYYFVNSVS